MVIDALQSGRCGPTQQDDGRRRGNSDFLRELQGQDRAGSAKHVDSGSSTTRRNAHKEKVGQTRDTGQSHSWNTGGLCFDIRDSQNQKLQSRGKHTFMSTDHVVVFLETDMSKEVKKHTNKTHIKHWNPSPQSVKKRRSEDRLDKMARNSGKCLQQQQKKMWMLHAIQEKTRSCRTC